MNEQETAKPEGAPPPATVPKQRAPWRQPTLVDYGSIRHLVRAASGPIGDQGGGGIGMRMILM